MCRSCYGKQDGPSRGSITIKVDVDTSEIDIATSKLNTLKELQRSTGLSKTIDDRREIQSLQRGQNELRRCLSNAASETDEYRISAERYKFSAYIAICILIGMLFARVH